MKFVHCADVHLHPQRQERLEALQRVCEKTREWGADLLMIAGDLFDSNPAAAALRVEVRRLFDSLSFPVLIVAGNHDEESYSEGVTYGERVTVVGGETARVVEYGGIPFLCLPFVRGRRANELMESVSGECDYCRAIVAHASFFAADPRWAGIPLKLREEEPQEFAMVQEDVVSRRVGYVALGHWHQPTDPPLQLEDTLVAYCGTPCPTSRKELGRRKIALIELEENGPPTVSFEILQGVPFNITQPWFVVMGQEEKTLNEIEAFLKGECADPFADLTIGVKGYLETGEPEFKHRLEQLCDSQRDRWHTISPEFSAVHFEIGKRPAIQQFLECIEDIEAPAADRIFEEPELRAIAQDLLNSKLTDVKADALSYGIRAFSEVIGR